VDLATARLRKAAQLAAEATARDSSAVPLESWVNLYFRLGDAESRRGAPEAALPYFQKAVEAATAWADSNKSLGVRNSLRAAYGRLAGAQLASGDLNGARDTYQKSLDALEELLREPSATISLQYSLSPAHRAVGDVLGSPDELNLGDRAGAISHYKAAIEVAERLAAADQREVRSREDLQTSYRRLGTMLLEKNPAEALRHYRKAFAITEALSQANLSNLNTRRDLVVGRMAIGEALHKLGKNKEALDYLTPALEMMEGVVAAAPHQIFWIETVVRAHSDIGDVLLDLGKAPAALEHYRAELAAAEKLLRQAPSNLYFQRDRADAFESLGRYYASIGDKTQARAWFEKSQTAWRDWTIRKVAVPFAIRRESRVAASLDALDQP